MMPSSEHEFLRAFFPASPDNPHASTRVDTYGDRGRGFDAVGGDAGSIGAGCTGDVAGEGAGGVAGV